MLNLRLACALVLAVSLNGNTRAQDVPSEISVTTSPSPATPNAALPAEPKDMNDQTDSADWKARIEAAQQRHESWLVCIANKGSNCSRSTASDPMQALLNDETLVSGDIVSTPKGLKVFRGHPEIPHSLSDFK
jgi:hypothetical protein